MLDHAIEIRNPSVQTSGMGVGLGEGKGIGGRLKFSSVSYSYGQVVKIKTLVKIPNERIFLTDFMRNLLNRPTHVSGVCCVDL